MRKDTSQKTVKSRNTSTEDILCACLNVSRIEAQEFLLSPGNTVEGFVKKTQMGTKCAACLLDLDILLEELDSANPRQKFGDLENKETRKKTFGMGSVDRVDSGFFVCDNEVKTVIRLANFNPLFRDGHEATPHKFKLLLMAENGAIVASKNGDISKGEQISIDLSEIDGCPEQGWFLLSSIPLGMGFYGTLRPQVLLIGKDWASACHTQFHGFASNQGRRVAVGIKATGGKTWSKVCVINGGNSMGEVILRAQGSKYKASYSFQLPSKGSKIISLDEVLPDLPSHEHIVLNVDSELLTRKYLINTQPDGSWGADHFPTFP